MRAPTFLLMLAAAGCAAPERPASNPFAATGELIALSGGDAGAENACIACHGLDGEGNAGAPRLAGLDVGYLGRQMEYYAAGLRQHLEMHAIAKRLSQRERQAVARWYARMSYSPPANAEGEPVGASLYLAACASCHGARGEGVGLGNPPLAGQPAAYLEAQLIAWREGRRRGDPLNQMLNVSQALTPAEVRSVAAYAAALPGSPPRRGYREASLRERRGDPRNGA